MSNRDWSQLSTQDKLDLIALLDRRQQEQELLGVATYRPHKKQDKFHRLGRFKFRYLRTGNRFGKSDCGSAEDVAWALGYRPWYPEGDPARYEGIKQKPNAILILCTDWGKADEIFTREVKGSKQGKLWKWIPKEAFVRRDTQHSGEINQITVKSIWGGESLIIIDTVNGWKMNSLRGESSSYDAIHVDEPIPKAMWESYSRGLIDTNGFAWFTCTPLREPWINRFFIDNPRVVLDKNEPNIFEDANGKMNRVVLVGSSDDNPYVPPDAIDDYMAGLDDRTLKARRFGLPIDQSGRVHYPFEDRHVYYDTPKGWSDVNVPPFEYTVRVHIDFHLNTPYAVLFAATSPSGQVFFYDEIWEQCSTQVLADMIIERTKNYFCPVVWMDPSGFVETMRSETTFADDLAAYGVVTEKASKDLTRGIKMTNQLLMQEHPPVFGNHLRRTLFEFEEYVLDDPEKKPDKPRDKHDHMMEGLHRLCLGGLDYISPTIFEMPKGGDTRSYLLSV